jgi:hypothetical protein
MSVPAGIGALATPSARRVPDAVPPGTAAAVTSTRTCTVVWSPPSRSSSVQVVTAPGVQVQLSLPEPPRAVMPVGRRSVTTRPWEGSPPALRIGTAMVPVAPAWSVPWAWGEPATRVPAPAAGPDPAGDGGPPGVGVPLAVGTAVGLLLGLLPGVLLWPPLGWRPG